MSWSVSLVGKPEKVAEALKNKSQEFSGQSKVEYDDALPHLVGLVSQNFNNNGQLIKLTANGYGLANGSTQTYRNCTVQIESIYGALV